jgi:two-component system, sensor histidine kinase and response regulator
MNNIEPEKKKKSSRILIVDDNRINLEILQDFLEDEFDVLTAVNGNDAIERVKTEMVDLILLDIMMPDISGYEVCRIIKGDPELRRIPIIMVTAKSDASDKVKGLDLGADDYVVKPFNFDELLARIHSQLRIYQLQEQIAKSRMENELNMLKLDFLSIVSHELRTPLHSILGFSELMLSNGSLSEKHRNYLKEINNGGKRLKELIENLLLYTQISADLYDKDIRKVDISEQITDIKDIFTDKLAKKNIQMETYVEDGLTLDINPGIFNEIMFKTIDNAIKFSQPNSSVSVKALKEENFIKIKISDFGVGVSNDVKERMFNLFTQGNKSYKTRAYEGLGLGLALVLRLIQYIKGSITVEENEPQGSTFIITIPVQNAPSTE